MALTDRSERMSVEVTPVLWVNGRYVAREEPALRADDRGLLYGDGFFDTLRVYSGAPFRLAAHLDRLRSSCERFGIDFGLSGAEAGGVIRELLERNHLDDAVVRTTVTRGVHTGVIGLPPSSEPTVIIEARPLGTPPEDLYRRGCTLHVASFRVDPAHPLSGHKSLHYLPYLAAREEARRAGCDEALLLSTTGYLAEAATSNLFCVREGWVLTPGLQSGALPGITRRVVIELCRRAHIPCAEEDLTLAQAVKSDELFLTNSVMEIMPVRALQKHTFPGAVPGPLTRRLQDLYRQLVREETAPSSGE